MFEERLKKLREDRGWTQKQVAEALEINPRTYSSYENNEREPNSEILLMLANLFDISIDYLIGFDRTRISKRELGRKQTQQLTQAEIELIKNYRKLSYQGKNYIKTTIDMCKMYFSDNKSISNSEEYDINRYAKIAAEGGEITRAPYEEDPKSTS